MYAICSTKKEDVAKCVQEMVDNKYHMPVVQFGATKYRSLEKDRSLVIAACKKVAKEMKYVINLDTRKVHKKGCKCHGKNVVGARLVRLRTTGLMNCMKCMK